MNEFVPHNNHVVCKCITSNEKTTASGFVYKSNDLPLYKIVKMADDIKDSPFNVGDVVVSVSTGTKFEKDGVEYVLFNVDNIAAKTI